MAVETPIKPDSGTHFSLIPGGERSFLNVKKRPGRLRGFGIWITRPVEFIKRNFGNNPSTPNLELALDIIDSEEIRTADLQGLTGLDIESQFDAQDFMMALYEAASPNSREALGVHSRLAVTEGRVIANFLSVLPADIAAALVYGAVNPTVTDRLYKDEWKLPWYMQGKRGYARQYAAEALLLMTEQKREEVFREMTRRDLQVAGDRVARDLLNELSDSWSGNSETYAPKGTLARLVGPQLIFRNRPLDPDNAILNAHHHLRKLGEVIEETYQASQTALPNTGNMA